MVEFIRIDNPWMRIHFFISFFDGCTAENNGDERMTFETDECGAALGAQLLFDSDFFIMRVWCLASGVKTRVAGTLIYDFKHHCDRT